jgi:hypothetical protein
MKAIYVYVELFGFIEFVALPPLAMMASSP